VNFVPETYTITASTGDYGSISPVGPVSIEHGSSQTYTISADPGYSIVDVKVDGVLVTGYWSTGISGSDQCTTGTTGPGQCEIVKRNLKNNVSSVTFTVSDLSGSDSSYDGIANHDPDGDSNGTTIIILKDAIPPLLGDTPMHVGDLDGSSALASKGNRWVATLNYSLVYCPSGPFSPSAVSEKA